MSFDISIVIPAFNEAAKIGADVRAAAAFVAGQNIAGEVIVVDDGSTDTTAEAARSAEIPAQVKRIVIRLEQNSGKGAAVKTGVLKSKGDIVLFTDSGLCVPFADSLPAMERIRGGLAHIALASRLHKDTKILRNRPLKRRLLSRLFHFAAVLITGLPGKIKDSQCGFKLYKGDIARELFKECRSTGYLFELEIFLRALRKGYRIEEFPIRWTCDLDTRLRPGKDAFAVLKELFFVRRTLKN